jgi:hypothetical protein
MGKALQEMILKADVKTIDLALNLLDGGDMMDDDFNEIYHQIIECGMTSYGAAKFVNDSGRSARNMRTLVYHAHQIEVNLLEFLGQVTPNSLLEELMTQGELDCPDELVPELDKLIKENEYEVEKWAHYSLSPSTNKESILT